MSEKAEFFRTGRFIRQAGFTKPQEFKSISLAKKWSRDWQKANGGLGVGKLLVLA